MHHEQDMRKMGGLARKIPFTYWMMLIGTLALTGVGIPHLIGFAGFFSKDAIIEAAFAAQRRRRNYAFWLLVVAAAHDRFYSWRLIFMTFHGEPRADHDVTTTTRTRARSVMLVPLLMPGRRLGGGRLALPDFFIGEALRRVLGKRRCSSGPGNHILEAMHARAALGRLARRSWRWSAASLRRLPVLHPLARRCRSGWPREQRRALPLPAQQVVLRRALRLPLRAPGHAGSAGSCGSGGDGCIIDGLGPDGISARVHRRDRAASSGCRPATSITTPSPC